MGIDSDLKISKSLELSKKSIINIMFTGNHVLNEINSILKPFGITNQQYNVLRILRGQGQKPVTQSSIQERMINRSSNTTRLIDKLLLKEYVERSVNKDNRRKINVSITNNGLELLKTLDPLVNNLEEKLVERLTNKDMIALNQILDTIRD